MVGAREARTEMPAQVGMRYERIANPAQPDASEIKNTCQNLLAGIFYGAKRLAQRNFASQNSIKN
jgi:hypothetical protein